MHAKSLTRTALCVCIICICSWVTIPGTVPHTLQVMGVFFALFVLDGARGTFAVSVYILLGAVGLPVYSSFGAGVGVLFGPTGGFIVGFLAACVVYTSLSRVKLPKLAAAYVSLVAMYTTGTLWFSYVTHTSLLCAVMAVVVPFAVLDIIKVWAAYFLCRKIKRIF